MEIPSKSRIYANALEQKDPEIYEYVNLKLKFGNISKYKITNHIGKGRYSNVFEGYYMETDKVIVKILRPIDMKKIKREIAVLTTLSHESIVKLIEILTDDMQIYYSLVFQYVKHESSLDIFKILEMEEIKIFSRKILEALDYAHSNGIMHRDIKPGNMVINRNQRVLKIIDWGLAEFYIPYKPYHVSVGTRYYKSPEILMGYRYYDYSLDIWSFGCILADMFFKSDEPFFFGKDNPDQLKKIQAVLGYEDLQNFAKKYNTRDPQKSKNKKRKKLKYFYKKEILTDDEVNCIDLLEKILRYDHQERFTARECLVHPFFMDL